MKARKYAQCGSGQIHRINPKTRRAYCQAENNARAHIGHARLRKFDVLASWEQDSRLHCHNCWQIERASHSQDASP